jgi:hypothetical protein
VAAGIAIVFIGLSPVAVVYLWWATQTRRGR